jgi:hypothetical protein
VANGTSIHFFIVGKTEYSRTIVTVLAAHNLSAMAVWATATAAA